MTLYDKIRTHNANAKPGLIGIGFGDLLNVFRAKDDFGIIGCIAGQFLFGRFWKVIFIAFIFVYLNCKSSST